ncbi:FecCD family ABC transporter permease [Amphiplicatus metriothermophilus]|uniref:Iron complex transport system permease protein n=1 Tax=Amphiplicatus metriothermophilus TaxID=1519374 RepID=A0A239PK93_9PROT|nr:iron ABC transporter permease [Amphiplicatus metriothermophilus]MBB5517424.1 iron complex transport system permease protein [Amphiplicatus metriothermophilus]SNT68241.1 iron complex transport system permease protein [Amphiplicatus metriothermophilus]
MPPSDLSALSRAAFPATALLAGAGATVIVVSCLFGPAPIGVGAALAGLVGAGDPAIVLVAQEVRLPRALAAWLAGAALGAAGAGLQGLLRNPLADPGVLGVSAAAALGAVIAIYFNLAALAFWMTPLASILFALGATGLLYILGAGRVSTARLILVGVGISSFCGALTALVMNLAPNPFVLTDLVSWLFGSVANRSFPDLALAAPFLAAGLAMLLLAAPGLRALTLGEEAAFSLGADLPRLRLLTIAGAALMVGASVSIAGAIGFVGVVAPHLARPFVGHDPARAIIPAALVGGALVAAADFAVRLLPFEQELRLGVAAALIGAPGFVWIAARTRRLAA